MDTEKRYTNFGRQVSYVVGANIAIGLLGFIQLAILTKGLGITLYGTWSLIIVTISVIVPFALLSLNDAIVRFLTAEKDKGRISEDFLSALATVCICGITFSILLFLFSDYLASLIFKDINSSSYIKLASILILFNSLDGLTLAFFRMQLKMGLFVAFNLGQNIIRVGFIFAALSLGYKLTGVIFAVIGSEVIFLILKLFITLRQTGLHMPHFSNIKSYLRWGIPLTPNVAILWIIDVSDRYVISYFLGVAAVGIYNAAYTIAGYATFILLPLGTVLYPTIIKSYEEGRISETKNYLKYSLKYFMMIAVPSAFGLTILAEPLLSILTRPEFVAGKAVVPFVAFGTVLFGFYRIYLYIILLANKTHLTLRLLGISAIINIILNILLIPLMGILGAAVATFVAYGVLGILGLMVSRRYMKFDLSLHFMLKSAIASSIMMLCIWLLNPKSITTVLISILCGILIYFGVLLITKGLNKSEISFFLNFSRDTLRKIYMLK